MMGRTKIIQVLLRDENMHQYSLLKFISYNCRITTVMNIIIGNNCESMNGLVAII